MRFALINNERVEATPKAKGVCPACAQPVDAKCGAQRIWHWAHRTKIVCDSWQEKETEWHRAWKSNFPKHNQEFIMYDKASGEKHVADVRTDHGLVIEFQHSHIDPQERVIREKFYGNMVWVADGTRLKKDHPRFVQGMHSLRKTMTQGFFLTQIPERCFPKAWLESSVAVVFDFRETSTKDQTDIVRDGLWILLPGRTNGQAVVVATSRQSFVTTALSRAQLLPVQEIIALFTEDLIFRQIKARQQHAKSAMEMRQRGYYPWPRQRRRF